MAFEAVANTEDLWDGEMRGVELRGKKIVLLNMGGNFFAYEDRCPHQSVPLSEGNLNNCVLTCTTHGWEFDATSGKGINPDSKQLRSYPIRITDKKVFIDIEDIHGS